MKIFSSTQSKSALAFSTPTSTNMSDKTMIQSAGASPNDVANLAIVSDDILPHQTGRVSFQSSWWPALCQQKIRILAGTTVRVIGRSNITLIVEPILNQPQQ